MVAWISTWRLTWCSRVSSRFHSKEDWRGEDGLMRLLLEIPEPESPRSLRDYLSIMEWVNSSTAKLLLSQASSEDFSRWQTVSGLSPGASFRCLTGGLLYSMKRLD